MFDGRLRDRNIEIEEEEKEKEKEESFFRMILRIVFRKSKKLADYEKKAANKKQKEEAKTSLSDHQNRLKQNLYLNKKEKLSTNTKKKNNKNIAVAAAAVGGGGFIGGTVDAILTVTASNTVMVGASSLSLMDLPNGIVIGAGTAATAMTMRHFVRMAKDHKNENKDTDSSNTDDMQL